MWCMGSRAYATAYPTVAVGRYWSYEILQDDCLERVVVIDKLFYGAS